MVDGLPRDSAPCAKDGLRVIGLEFRDFHTDSFHEVAGHPSVLRIVSTGKQEPSTIMAMVTEMMRIAAPASGCYSLVIILSVLVGFSGPLTWFLGRRHELGHLVSSALKRSGHRPQSQNSKKSSPNLPSATHTRSPGNLKPPPLGSGSSDSCREPVGECLRTTRGLVGFRN